MIAKQVGVKKNEIPHGWSFEAADFINKVCFLSRRNPVVPAETARESSGGKWAHGGQTAYVV